MKDLVSNWLDSQVWEVFFHGFVDVFQLSQATEILPLVVFLLVTMSSTIDTIA